MRSGNAGADVVGDPLAERAQRRRDARRSARRAERQPLAAVGEHVERVDVVDGLAPRHRVRAAGVVADHPAERAAVVGRRVGAERQPVRRGGVAQRRRRPHRAATRAVRASGSISRTRFRCRVKSSTTAVLTAWPAIDVPAPTRQHRHVVRAADRDGGLDVGDVARRDHADRHPPVVRRVGRPHRPVARRRTAPRRRRPSRGWRQVAAESSLVVRPRSMAARCSKRTPQPHR